MERSATSEESIELMRLAPELQVKVFESLPDMWSAIALRLSCRTLNTLYLTYRKQIDASIRDKIVDLFHDYYDFLGGLHIPASAIKRPPPGGWLNMTPENCAGFNKTDFAIDVLRHLPCMEEDEHRNVCNIDYKCEVNDYSTATTRDFSQCRFEGLEELYASGDPGITVPRSKVSIARGYESGGMDLMLDMMTGVMFEEIVRVGPGEVLPLDEYFEKRKSECRNLQCVFVPGHDPHWAGFSTNHEGPYEDSFPEDAPEPTMPDEMFMYADEDVDWVRHLYCKFGWPSSEWRKEEGLKAIAEYAERREAEYDARRQ